MTIEHKAWLWCVIGQILIIIAAFVLLSWQHGLTFLVGSIVINAAMVLREWVRRKYQV